jgi:DNA repair exonuclease SbcCD ATPase subunit
LNDRARAALQKNLELKQRLLKSYSEAGGNMKALETELDSMQSLLEVLHQNSLSLRDPQAISDELDTIVRQSEASERAVREFEAMLRAGGGEWTPDLEDIAPPAAPPGAGTPPPRQKAKER